MKKEKPSKQRIPQKQTPPGIQKEMIPEPEVKRIVPKKKLEGKVAVITGGDSGIGQAVAVAFAQQGANVAIMYLSEHSDAVQTQALVEETGQKCLLISGDIGDEAFCCSAIKDVVQHFGKIDILVNNAAEQHPQKSIEDITAEQLEKTSARIFIPFSS
jgi:NAD(P)-dependent dehydrogenase (short-subunit alcohol dehydrogenase family)